MNCCILCRSSEDDELLYGKLYKQTICVHEKCLYLSSNLVQRYNSNSTILDFDVGDIRTEADRVGKLKCCYCLRVGANIGCCNIFCRRTFHTSCGLKRHAQNQFTGRYSSYCHTHVLGYKDRPDPEEKCAICFERLINGEEFKCTTHIHGKCCNKGWYHKLCLQRYANSSGYFFKCPLCNNSKKFRLVVEYGISIPDCDASWENDDMYEDHFTLQTVCSAADCVAPSGRESDELQLLYCRTCGSNPMHPDCTSFNADEYRCNTCAEVLGMGKLDCIDDIAWLMPDDTESDSEFNARGRRRNSAMAIHSSSSSEDEGDADVTDVNGYGDDANLESENDSDSDMDAIAKLVKLQEQQAQQSEPPRVLAEISVNADDSMAACGSDTDWDKVILQFERDKENKEANVLWAKQSTGAAAGAATPATGTPPCTSTISPLRLRSMAANEDESDSVVEGEEPASKKRKMEDKEEDDEETSSDKEEEEEDDKPSTSITKEKKRKEEEKPKESKEPALAQTNPSPNLISLRSHSSRPNNVEPANCVARRTRARTGEQKHT